jgi:7-cyano-7-deazaguanine tRNA-ribosyltransferase
VERDPAEYTEFEKTWKAFFENNKFKKIHIADDKFLRHFAKSIPGKTRTKITKIKKKG